MRLKRTMALLMAVFLLAGPSWAAACDIACAGTAQHHACSICGSTEHTAAAHMHCVHAESHDGSRSVHVGLAASSHCTHLLCKQATSAILPSKSFQPKLLEWSVIRPATAFEAGALLLHPIGRAPPPRLTDSRRPLILSLRV